MSRTDKKLNRIERLSEKQLLISNLSHLRAIEALFGVLSRKIVGVSQQNSFILRELVKQGKISAAAAVKAKQKQAARSPSKVSAAVYTPEAGCSVAEAEINTMKRACGLI